MIDFTAKTYQNILRDMLDRVPNSYDKRDTSPIMTALGPAAYALEEFYIALARLQESAFIQTASGEDLDALAVIGGVFRFPATDAIRLGLFDATVPLGSRFSTINGANSINFTATAAYTRTITAAVSAAAWEASDLGGSDGSFVFTLAAGGWEYAGDPVILSSYGVTVDGALATGDYVTVTRSGSSVTAAATKATGIYSYELTAETAGSIGNEYAGTILPISVIPGLTAAEMTDILVLGDDTETDSELRERLIESLTASPFAGNVTAYREHCMAIDGVGAVQVYPCGDGAGTVVLSILGTDLLPASDYVVSVVQTDVDPEVNQGIGIGYAPIGATVTVAKPDAVSINVAATLTLSPGTSLETVRPLIEAALESYMAGIRESWDINVSASAVQYLADVYLSKVTSAIVSVPGVINASSVTINRAGSSPGTSDITLTETGATQEVPVLGTVTLNE